MPSATAHAVPRFVRRTVLHTDEYHTNFRKIDGETISLLTSDEAGRVSSQVCKVYLSLVNSPPDYWEREGVLRFAGRENEGEWQTAWEQLVSLLGVASGTARKVLTWMSQEGIIGYFAGKNGVGIRIFINRAASSIGHRREAAGQKNLRLVRASSDVSHTSNGDMPFKDSFADLEVSDTDSNPRAPKNGADKSEVDKKSPDPASQNVNVSKSQGIHGSRGIEVGATTMSIVPQVDEVVRRLRHELEPVLNSAAAQAARREHERTREWLETRGLPKAARVAQRETYNVLRSHGVINTAAQRSRADLEVGRNNYTPPEAKPLSAEETKEFAEMCVVMFEVHGQAIDVTLSELSAEAGGCLLAEDAPRVRALAESMVGIISPEE